MAASPATTSDSFLSHVLSGRNLLTAGTGALLMGCYALYTVLVSPLIESTLPRLSQPTAVERIDRPLVPSQLAARWLASQPWAANAKYNLRTEQAFVYFEEWEPVDSDRAIRFAPFAVVWRREGDADDQPPLTIVSESAHIRFADEFSVSSPDAGRIIGGALQGDVVINGPEGLDVTGRNFAFSEGAMRVWSDNRVEFRYGPHAGHAHGVQIELIPAPDKEGDASLAISGIRSLRLRRNVSMNMQFQQDAMGGNNPADSVAAEAPPGSDLHTVRIRSAGSFNFTVATHVATFEENVRVYRPTGPEKFDSLQCDLLTLLFEPRLWQGDPPPEVLPISPATEGGHEFSFIDRVEPLTLAEDKPATADEDDDEFQGLNSNLTFRRLRAEGRSVILLSQENNLTAHMTEMVYDARTRVARMTDGQAVRVQRGPSRMQAPEVILAHAENGDLESALCHGAGWMQHYDEATGQLQLAAQWNRQLHQYPDHQLGLDVIELEEQAIVRQVAEKTGLAADFIRLWIERTDTADNSGNPPRHATPAGSEDPLQQAGSQMQPRKLLARTNVAMVSPQMMARTEQLEVWFEKPQPRSPAPPGLIGRARKGLRPAVQYISESTPPNNRQPIRTVAGTDQPRGPALSPLLMPNQPASPIPGLLHPPGTTPPSAGPALSVPEADAQPSESTDDTPAAPIDVRADRMRVRVILADQGAADHGGSDANNSAAEAQVAEVWTEGNVNIRQPRKEPGEFVELGGHQLHLQNRGDEDQLVHIYGNPAHIRDGQVHIEGNKLHLDRSRNLAWVEGTGLLELPVGNNLEGEKLTEPQVLTVKWAEKMVFDGSSANFYGNVLTVLQDSRMQCQEMQVVLSRPVSFAEQQQPQQEDVDILEVKCRDEVQFASYAYAENRLIEIRRGRFSDFTLNQQSGLTTATGPGWITFWRRGDGNRAGLVPNANVTANRPQKNDQREWEYTRIDFAGTTDGNLRQRFTTFKDRVQIVYGPVDKPLETINADELPDDAGWMRCDSLQFTQHEKTDTAPAFIELLGQGNAELEGRMFHARADLISYDESKGLYMLRSLGNRKASIWRQKQHGGDYSRADAQRMEFVPARNHLKWDRATGLDAIE